MPDVTCGDPRKRVLRGLAPLLVGVLAALALGSCAGGGGGGGESPPAAPQPRNLSFEEVFAGSSGSGRAKARVIVSPDPEVIKRQPEVAGLVLDKTGPSNLVYVAVFDGQRNTGGYSISVARMERKGDSVTVTVERLEPPDGSIVSQALTYPCVVVSTGEISPPELGNLDFRPVTRGGERLDWPVRVAGG